MSLSILNNIPSLEAQNQLATTNMNLQNTLFQLSSGSKINSGADDPAGLSIADGLQANISALTQSVQNVTDGVGMLQTADGALSQVTTLLNRAVTLATEAGNAGLTTDQQNALQTEYASITQEINQIGSNTTYNNNQVFTSQLTSVFLSDGSQTDAADPTISVTIPTLSSSALGLASYAQGTIDLTGQPAQGNTIQIGNSTYTFVSPANVTAAGDVAISTIDVNHTLQNLQDAVNGGPGAGSTYGAGTVANTAAQITSVNGGSASVQAMSAGAAGNLVQVVANLTSGAGTSGAILTGGAAATNNTGTLTLTGAPVTQTQASAAVNLTSLPNILTSAQGTIDLGAAQPTAGTEAVANFSLSAGQPATGNANGVLTLTANLQDSDKLQIGGTTYTFLTTLTGAANQVHLGGTASATIANLQEAMTGGANAGTDYINATNNTSDVISVNNIAGGANTGTVTFASTTKNGGAADAFVFTMKAGNTDTTNVVNGGGTLTAAGQSSDKVTIGGTVYTFVAANAAVAAGEVAVSNLAGQAGINATMANLVDAVNGVVPGSINQVGGAAAANAYATMSFTNGNNFATLQATTAGLGVSNGASSTGTFTQFTANIAANGSAAGAFGAATNGDTLQIGGQIYTFVAAGDATQANYVAVGTDNTAGQLAATLEHLTDAVNGTHIYGAAGNGTFGVGSTAASVAQVLYSGAGNTATVQATTSGNPGGADLGNNVTFAATGSLLTAGDVAPTGTLAGGQLADTVLIGTTTYTFVGAGQASGADMVAIVDTPTNTLAQNITATLQNLEGAVNGSALNSNGNAITQNNNSWGLTTQNNKAQISVAGQTATVTAAASFAAGAAGNNNIALQTTGSLAADTTGLGNITNNDALVGGAYTTTGKLAGGLNADTIAIGPTATPITYTFVAAGTNMATIGVGNFVAVGTGAGAAQTTLTNLESALAATNPNSLASVSGAGFSVSSFQPANGATIGGITENATVPTTYSATITADKTGTLAANLVSVAVTGSAAEALSGLSAGATGNLSGGANQALATGTLTFNGNPEQGNTVNIAGQVYTFVQSGNANAVGDVAIDTTNGLSGTLTNLFEAVNGVNGSGNPVAGSATTFDNGGTANLNATVLTPTVTNGIGMVQVQALATASANGNGLALAANLSSTANGGLVPTQTTLAGGTATTKASGTLTLPSTLTQGSTMDVAGTTYTFVGLGDAVSGNNDVVIGTSTNATLNNLASAVNAKSTSGGSINTYYVNSGSINSPVTMSVAAGATTATVTANADGTAGNNYVLTLSTGTPTLGGGGSSVDLTSSSNAQNALTVIAGAISSIAASRGAIGSSINQMNAAVQVMNSTTQNLTSSLSGIQDANIGQVVANMSKYQVLEQTGIAALTQANQQEQTVLKLLQ